ncbi:MAG TPA: hypothetical protein VK152_12965 [Paludibacter sp.]|nr:hypothetical protein [Paludibacter sp.]
MKKIFTICILFVSICIVAKAEGNEFSKVPKQLSFEAGYRNSFYRHTGLNNPASNGYGWLLDYGWKLSGLNGKRPGVYLTVPIGYSVLYPDNALAQKISMLNYGWAVRHELSTNEKIVPFVGYGLFLNRLYLNGTPGSVTGHQTQFEGGLNFKTSTRLIYFVKLNCSYSSYPKLGDSKSLHFMYADLRAGVRL